MKPVTFAFILSAVSFKLCDATGTNKNHHHQNNSHTTENHASYKKEISTKETNLIDGYLRIKDALISSASKEAAKAAEDFLQLTKQFKSQSSGKGYGSKVAKIVENASKQAEYISQNRNDINHQRKHLETLSNELKKLIDIIGNDYTLYQQYCPMALNGKGAHWLSSSQKIENPYFGDAMLRCGSIKEKINPKK